MSFHADENILRDEATLKETHSQFSLPVYYDVLLFVSTVYASVHFVTHLCLLRAESREIHVHSIDATKSAVP